MNFSISELVDKSKELKEAMEFKITKFKLLAQRHDLRGDCFEEVRFWLLRATKDNLLAGAALGREMGRLEGYKACHWKLTGDEIEDQDLIHECKKL